MGLFSTGSTFCSVVQSLVSLINLTIGVLATLAVVLFFWGLVRYIRESSDSHGHSEAKERIIWSLISLFILFSIWGILALMTVAFFGGGTPGSGGTATSCSGAPLQINSNNPTSSSNSTYITPTTPSNLPPVY